MMLKSVFYLSSVLLIAGLFAFSSFPEPNHFAEDELSNEESFDMMMQVITHQRCMNCHPSDDTPKQGNESRVHDFGVI